MDIHQLSNIIYEKILKIHNRTIFLVLKLLKLPKCVIKHIITKFCNSEPLEILKLDFYESENSKRIDSHVDCPIYGLKGIHYRKSYEIEQKCLIVNHDNNEIYIDSKFSAYPELSLYELNTDVPNENILVAYGVILDLAVIDYYSDLEIPLFSNNFIEILRNNEEPIKEAVLTEIKRFELRKKIHKLKMKIHELELEEMNLL